MKKIISHTFQKLPAISCKHDDIVESGGETVCTKCGVVLDMITAEPAQQSTSITNLFERHTIGGKNIFPKIGTNSELRRYMRGSHTNIHDEKTKKEMAVLSKFSNCCESLGLLDAASEYAFALFSRARKSWNARQWPYMAVWALYRSSQAHAIPNSAKEISSVVCAKFNRSSMPDITKILYQVNDIDVAPTANYSKYNFRLTFKEALAGRTFHSDAAYAEIEENAWYLYNNVYIKGTLKIRAKKAIAVAFGVKD